MRRTTPDPTCPILSLTPSSQPPRPEATLRDAKGFIPLASGDFVLVTLKVNQLTYLARAIPDEGEGLTFQLWRSNSREEDLGVGSKFFPVFETKAGKEAFGPNHKHLKGMTPCTYSPDEVTVRAAKFNAEDGQVPAFVWRFVQDSLKSSISGGRTSGDSSARNAIPE